MTDAPIVIPTTIQVRQLYEVGAMAVAGLQPLDVRKTMAMFDRWLFEHDNETKATALAADQVVVTAPTARANVLLEVNAERDRQDAKWGEQNHPDGTGTGMRPLASIGLKPTANASAWAAGAKASTDELAAAGIVSYSDILLEEIFEALAERDPEKLRTELVQSAAVIVQWVEAIDRRAV